MAKLCFLFVLSLVLVFHATARDVPGNDQKQAEDVVKAKEIINNEVSNKVGDVGKGGAVKDKKCLVGAFGAVGGVAGVGAVVPLVGGLGGHGGASGLGGLGGLGGASGLGGLGGLGGGIGKGGGILP